MSPRAVVTGGGGFVGQNLCRRLIKEGYLVTSLSRGAYPELEKLGVQTVRLDLAEGGSALERALKGAEVVFHVAAKVDMWGNYQDFFRGNVLSTQNVIRACQTQGVAKLVYTSSPSVIADGNDLCGIDESYPYPKKTLAFYPATKAIAEQEVLAADGSAGLSTLALRPHLIWGPGDTNLIPTVVERAQAGRLVQIGNGENLSDFTYIDDCIEAHICAMRALENQRQSRGQAYFISQGDPVKLWWWVNQILAKKGLPAVSRSIPRWLADGVARCSEFYARYLSKSAEPFLTRFLVKEMATSHYFDISRARTLLGYQPQFTTAERLANFSF